MKGLLVLRKGKKILELKYRSRKECTLSEDLRATAHFRKGKVREKRQNPSTLERQLDKGKDSTSKGEIMFQGWESQPARKHSVA